MAEGKVCRVVHVVQQLDTGGMEKLLAEFARHVDRSQFGLRFVSLGARGSVAAEIEAEGWPVEALGIGEGLQFSLVGRLAKLFRRWETDVVHAHNSGPLIYCGPAARLARVGRVIYTRHGRRHEGSRRRMFLLRTMARCADAVACVSEDIARRVVEDGIPRHKVMKIHNGIDVSRFRYSGPRDDGPTLMIGRLSAEKDVATLLRAAAIVVRDDRTFRLDIAGDGACAADLRQLSGELGLNEHVRFLGHVQDTPALYAGSSMCVLPSLTEGISLVLLEAMARGLPVVATAVGGNPEVVLDRQTGLLAPAGDPGALALAIARLRADRPMAHAMGAAGRRRVEAHFDVRRMVGEYEALYRGIGGAKEVTNPTLETALAAG
jgi:glycosyltransferase involved in cell wall biosynthesis